MSLETLKTEIKTKFRTISRFAEVSGIPERDIRYLLSGKMSSARSPKFEKELRNVVRSIEDYTDSRFISPRDREYVRTTIILNYRSLRSFSKDYPDFSVSYLSNVITGRRIRRTKRFADLIGVLSYYRGYTRTNYKNPYR